MEHEHVGRFLEHKLGSAVEVTSIKRTFPGMSRETFLVRATVEMSDGHSPVGFVFRRDPVGGPVVPVPLRQEWEIYRSLAETDIPIGAPRWWEEDPAWLDDERPFFVRDLVEGSTEIPNLEDPSPEYDELRASCAREHAEKLAALHLVDWSALGLGELLPRPAGPEDCARRDFETWAVIWDQVRTEPDPLMTEALRWFEERLPRAAPRVALLKGNNGLGEEIWRDGRIVALSDFELATLGDPAQDWAWAAGEGMLALWDENLVLDHYESVAGYEIDRKSLAFYRLWNMVKILCCVQSGLRGFLAGIDPRPARATMGLGAAGTLRQVLGELVLEGDAEGALQAVGDQLAGWESR